MQENRPEETFLFFQLCIFLVSRLNLPAFFMSFYFIWYLYQVRRNGSGWFGTKFVFNICSKSIDIRFVSIYIKPRYHKKAHE